MDLGIKDKVALITAASQGLGKSVAWRLSLEGTKVVICSRSLDNLTKTADEISTDTGGNVRAITCDVTDENQVKGMVQDIVGEFGRLDILVCNAGGPPAGTAEDFELDDYRKALELNLLSTINLCNLTVPHMRKHKWGRIIGMTSVSVKQPIDNLILSNTARTGVTGYLKTLSNQVAPSG